MDQTYFKLGFNTPPIYDYIKKNIKSKTVYTI